MRYALLNILKSTNDYVSGETISSTLGVTRASIWKYIKALKSEGYIIDGISNRGYKLLDSPEILNKFEINYNLNTKILGKTVYHFSELESTNVKSKELVKSGAPDGSLVICDEQTVGKGRFSRHWLSPKGGLWFSLILKPMIAPQEAPKLTLLAATSLYKTLKSLNLNINIKWPNDLLINSKKFSGILTEMNADMDKVNYIILGIGINTNVDINEIPSEIHNKITTLQNETSIKISNINILCKFLKIFEEDYNEFIASYDISKAINLIKETTNIVGKNLSVHTIRESFDAKCIDIDMEGNLVLEKPTGEIIIQNSGEISLSQSLIK